MKSSVWDWTLHQTSCCFLWSRQSQGRGSDCPLLVCCWNLPKKVNSRIGYPAVGQRAGWTDHRLAKGKWYCKNNAALKASSPRTAGLVLAGRRLTDWLPYLTGEALLAQSRAAGRRAGGDVHHHRRQRYDRRMKRKKPKPAFCWVHIVLR